MIKSKNYFDRFVDYLKSAKFLIGILVIFTLMLAGLSLVFPVIWANILTGLINISNNTYLGFIKYVIIYIVLELIEGILSVIKNFIYSQMETKVSEEIKTDLFNKVLSLETKAFDRNRITYFTTKISEDPHTLISAFFKLISLLINLLKVVALLYITYKTCFDVAVIFAVASIIIYIAVTRIKPFIAKNDRILNYQVKEYTDSLYEDVRNIREIKNLGCKKIISDEFKENTGVINKKISSAKNVDNLMELLMFTIKFSIHSLVLIITTYYYFAQTVSFESIIMLELYAAILYSSVRQISEFKSIVLVYKNALKSIFDILQNKNYSSEKFGAEEVTSGDGDLIVKNLSYAFGSKKMILDDISFEIRKNSRVAIVDQGGNFKQILLKLLLRQYDPLEGRIMIDDVNIKDLTERALRKNIMLVSDKTFILNDTLENNIKIVKPNATIEEIVDVCKKTDILSWFDDDDMTLGDILSTKLGNNGMELTESQKQLISIARVLLVNPTIVIIEESQNEISSDDTFLIKNALDKIDNSTILIFSEKISSISVCDEIITLSTNRFGGASITQDVIRERNLIGGFATSVLNSRKNKNEIYYDEKEYDDRNENDLLQIKKLNMQKGAKTNEEHRIFSQIW